MKPLAGETHEAEIETLVAGGRGLARLDGWPVFVPLAVPGDRGRIRVDVVRAGFGEGTFDPLQVPSPTRRRDPCRHAGVCGGCDWPYLAQAEQEHWKVRLAREALIRVGRLEGAESLPLPIESFPRAYRLRSQLHLARGFDGAVQVGFHRQRSRDVVNVVDCEVVSPATLALLPRLRTALADVDPLPATVELVESVDGHERALRIEADLERADALWQRLRADAVGLLVVDAAGRQRRLGRPWVFVDVVGIAHRVSPGAFFQVNRHALATMVERVGAYLPQEIDTLWDLYCGGGLFALHERERARRVVGVEAEGAGLADARATTAKLAVTNIEWVGEPVERFLERHSTPADAAIVDPPRAGLGRRVRAVLARRGPPRLVYVACDVVTFARDLRELSAAGYRVTAVRLLDLFPGTHRVEAIAQLDRR